MNTKQSIVGFIALVLIGFTVPVMGAGNSDGGIKIVIESGDKTFFYNNNFSWNYSGYIEVTNNDEDIVSVSPNGFFEVKKVTFGNNRRIEISSDENGNLTKKYFEGKNEESFEEKGKQWLADILPTIVRASGVGAECRVHRIFKNEGMQGLLDEIDEVEEHNSAVRNLYFIIMVDQLKLSDKDIQTALPHMERIVSNSKKGTLMRELLTKYELSNESLRRLLETTSTLTYNTERGSTLRVFNKQLVEDDEILDVYFDIIEEMGINSEKGNVLKHLIQNNKLKTETWLRLFKSLDSFSSAREAGAILLMAIEHMPENEAILEGFNMAVEELDDNYYILKGEILNKMVDHQVGNSKKAANQKILLSLLESTDDIESNSQKGATMRKVNSMMVMDNEVFNAYQDAMDNFSEKLELYNVLLDFIRSNQLTPNAYKMVLDITEDLVDDDYQHAAGAVIRECLEDMPNNRELMEDLFDVVEDMDQNSTIEEILRLVSENSKFNKDGYVLSRIIECTNSIDVDIEIASVLTGLEHYDKNSHIQSVPFEYSIEQIKWDYLRRKVEDFEKQQ